MTDQVHDDQVQDASPLEYNGVTYASKAERDDAEARNADAPRNALVFSANEFWEGQPTHQIRHDEVNALRAAQTTGVDVATGDASAQDIVDQLLKRAGVTGHPLFSKLATAFADAIMKVAGDDPRLWVNPLFYSSARTRGAAPVSVDGSTYVSGYPQPTEDAMKAQDKAATDATPKKDETRSSGVGAVDSEGNEEVLESAPSVGASTSSDSSTADADAKRKAQIAELRRLTGQSD
jgi:hypothetical protein